MDNIEERVCRVVEGWLEVDPQKIVPSATLMDDLHADSLDVIEVILGVEDEFNIEIPDEDTEEIKTVGDIISYVRARVRA